MEGSVDQELEKQWVKIREGVDFVFQHAPHVSKTDYMNLYSKVHAFCHSDHPRRSTMPAGNLSMACELYTRLKGYFQEYVVQLRNKLDLRGEELIKKYSEEWACFSFSSQIMNGIFKCLSRDYLNRAWPGTTEKPKEIYDLALSFWRDFVAFPLQEDISTVLPTYIERGRRGEEFDASLLYGITNCYMAMSFEVTPASMTQTNLAVYKQLFEESFLLEAENFYCNESIHLIHELDFEDYIKNVEHILLREQNNAKQFLHEDTLIAVMNICQNHLVKKYLKTFDEKLPSLLQDDREDDLGRIFRLVAKFPPVHKKYCDFLEQHVYSQGIDSISKHYDEAIHDPEIYVQTILSIIEKYSALVSTDGNDDAGYVAALHNACYAFTNYNEVTRKSNSLYKSAQLLARYCDHLLKSRTNLLETENALNKVMTVFKFIADKDVFLKYYDYLLAIRLIKERFANFDWEEIMVEKLTSTSSCSFGYKSKFRRMLQDISLSKSLSDEFNTYSNSKNPTHFNFSVKVLAMGSWTFPQSHALSLPVELENTSKRFMAFYGTKYIGRTLRWLHSMSNAEMVANCYTTKYIFKASAFQACVLLQYNCGDSFTLQELQERTQMKIELLLPVLQELLQSGLLTTGTQERNIQSSNISLNFGYKSKKRRVKIDLRLNSEPAAEQESTERKIDADRRCTIQAAIARIMKTRGVLKHKQLITEVTTQLYKWFRPSVAAVKECIGTLIDKELLERLDEDTYSYIP